MELETVTPARFISGPDNAASDYGNRKPDWRWKSVNQQVRRWFLSQDLPFSEYETKTADAQFGPPYSVPRVVSLLVKLCTGTCTDYVLVVTPAGHRIHLTEVRKEFSAESAWIAQPRAVASLTRCRVGQVPPFGSLYGMPVVIDARLTQAEAIFAPSGRPGHVVFTPVKRFLECEAPRIVSL